MNVRAIFGGNTFNIFLLMHIQVGTDDEDFN